MCGRFVKQGAKVRARSYRVILLVRLITRRTSRGMGAGQADRLVTDNG